MESAELKLKLKRRQKWRQKVPTNTFCWIPDHMESAELKSRLKRAPKISTNTFFWIHDHTESTKTAELAPKINQRIAPKPSTNNLIWIHHDNNTTAELPAYNLKLSITDVLKLAPKYFYNNLHKIAPKMHVLNLLIMATKNNDIHKSGYIFTKHDPPETTLKRITITNNALPPTHSLIHSSTFFMVNLSTTIGEQGHRGSPDCEKTPHRYNLQHNGQLNQRGQSGRSGQHLQNAPTHVPSDQHFLDNGHNPLMT
jgi:hypothetical protein